MGAFLVLRSFKAKNTILLIVFAFIFLYTLPPYSFYFKGIYLSGHNRNFTYETVNFVNLIFSLFLLSINTFIDIPKETELPKIKSENNQLIYFPLLILSFIIVLIAKRQGNVYSGLGEEVTVSSLNEYVLIFFALLIAYGGKYKLGVYLNNFLFLIYAFFAIIAGGRIELVLLFMLLFSVKYYSFFSLKKIIILCVFGFWIMSIFGNIRSNPQMLLTSEVTDILNPFSEKEYLHNSLNSNEGDVFWASERLVILKNEGILSIDKRIIAALSFFSSVLIPSSMLPEEGVLSSYRQDILTTGGGGLAPVYFYIFMGFPGVVLLGYFCAKILSRFKEGISKYRYFYSLFFIITVPRWISYTPISIIKLAVWAVIIYYFIKCIDFTIKKMSKNEQ
ncbi:MAG: hypothetical protein ACRC3Z_13390 [Phocaeicola sp.]